jgi:hypothetical protein
MSEKPKQYTVVLDFDGVVHLYDSPWQGADIIPDPPVPGALDFICQVVNHPELKLAIFSSRSDTFAGREAIRDWLYRHLQYYLQSGDKADDVLKKIALPQHKPPAILYIDDRGFHFNGTFPTLNWILSFKPWNKKERPHPHAPYRPTPERVQEIRATNQDFTYPKESWDNAIEELLIEIDHLTAGRDHIGVLTDEHAALRVKYVQERDSHDRDGVALVGLVRQHTELLRAVTDFRAVAKALANAVGDAGGEGHKTYIDEYERSDRRLGDLVEAEEKKYGKG